jgi:dihydrofolate reductase/thymidylate synthase
MSSPIYSSAIDNNNTYGVLDVVGVVDIIVAHSWPEMGIGAAGKLPWSIRADLLNFRKITASAPPNKINAVIMGRVTYESIPVTYRPLSGRLNIVITSTPYESGQELVKFIRLEDLAKTLENYQIHKKFIIGGGKLYDWAFKNCKICHVFATEVFQNEKRDVSKYDTFFPDYLNGTTSTAWMHNGNDLMVPVDVSPIRQDPQSGIPYRFVTYENTNQNIFIGTNIWSSPETQYLQIMNQIITDGIDRPDRTGTGTIALFGTRQEYNLHNAFPLCTTKRMFFRAIFEELALYLSGQTDNGILQQKDIHIWDGNTSREFLDRRGLTDYPEGDMGETYGFNFRHYGAEYAGCDKDYTGQGYDQIANLVHLLKTDPTSRRMIINLWNPATQHKAALPACLMMYQFFVDPIAKTLSVQIYLRSSDYFLANNWNACTGALLVHLLCRLEGIELTPGKLIVVTGDTHIYKTHLEQVNMNLLRQPFLPCQVFVKGDRRKNLTDFRFEDIWLVGYKSHPNIPAPMAV